jgi:hypothetical protein
MFLIKFEVWQKLAAAFLVSSDAASREVEFYSMKIFHSFPDLSVLVKIRASIALDCYFSAARERKGHRQTI